jgi:hypothetical protein
MAGQTKALHTIFINHNELLTFINKTLEFCG